MIEEINRYENETDFEYGLRLLTEKVEGKLNKDTDWQDIVDELGLNVHRDTLRKSFNKTDYCQEYGYSGYDILQYFKDKQIASDSTIRYKDNISLSSDGIQVSDKLIRLSEEELKDVNFILKSHGYDSKEWELINAKNSMWNVSNKQEGLKTLYSSKISVKPRVDTISLEEIQEHFENFTNNYKPRKVENSIINTTSGKMLEIPIMDLHLGKLSWNVETGENYDYKIAEERFFHAIDDIIQKTKCYKFEKIIFPIGNDFVNFDNIEGNTTGGTRQDNDLRWQKVYLKAMEILVKAIDMLKEIAPVEVFYVAGNHDKTTSFYLTCYLNGFFRNNDKVDISLSPNVRKYIEFGKVLIGYTHGNLEKKRINGLMQIEAREAWGRTRFHEFHLGHLHSEQTKEENGIIIRNISSITSGDAWHHESGYVGAIRKAQAFIWDKEYGLESIINSVIV